MLFCRYILGQHGLSRLLLSYYRSPLADEHELRNELGVDHGD